MQGWLLRIAALLLVGILATSYKPGPGIWASARGGKLTLTIWGGYNENLWFSEGLLIDVGPQAHSVGPQSWTSLNDITRYGGVILARRPATSVATDYAIPFKAQKGHTYWTAELLKDGSVEGMWPISKSTLENLLIQREDLVPQQSLEWIAVASTALITAMYLTRGRRIRRGQLT